MKNHPANRLQTRRDFFSMLVPALSVPAILWWLFTGNRSRDLGQGPGQLVVKGEVPAGVSFYNGIVLVKEEDRLRAFEARCTHLGCAITKTEGRVLVCQCHGSRFDLNGHPVQGPARKPLRELPVEQGNNGESIIRLQP
jgi:Rieske Fe-S protein